MAQNITTPHDRFFNRVWSRKNTARSFLRHYLPREVVALLDLGSLELTKDSLVDEKLRGHFSDLLYRARLKDGWQVFLYLLFEHKSTPEKLTAVQVLRYIVYIWEDWLRQNPDLAMLPPVLPVVVYHGDRPWPYGQTLQQAFPMPEALARYVPDFRFELVDLAAMAETDIRGAVQLQAAMLLMKYIHDAGLAERLPAIFTLLGKLRQRKTLLGFGETLLNYLATAATKVNDDDIRRALDETLPELEEVLMSTLAEKWLEQGQEQGQAKLLIRQLELRFGPLAARERERIAAADTEKLMAWGEKLLTAQRLEEVFD